MKEEKIKKELEELIKFKKRIDEDIKRCRNILAKKKFYKIRCFKCKWFILKSKDFGQFFCKIRNQYPNRTNLNFATKCDDFERR